MQKRWFDAVRKIDNGNLKIDVTLNAVKGLLTSCEMLHCVQHDIRVCSRALIK